MQKSVRARRSSDNERRKAVDTVTPVVLEADAGIHGLTLHAPRTASQHEAPGPFNGWHELCISPGKECILITL